MFHLFRVHFRRSFLAQAHHGSGLLLILTKRKKHIKSYSIVTAEITGLCKRQVVNFNLPFLCSNRLVCCAAVFFSLDYILKITLKLLIFIGHIQTEYGGSNRTDCKAIFRPYQLAYIGHDRFNAKQIRQLN